MTGLVVWMFWFQLCGDGVCTWAANEIVFASREQCELDIKRGLTPYYPVAPRWASYERMEVKQRRCVAVESPHD